MNENLLLPSMKPHIFLAMLIIVISIGFYIKFNEILDKMTEHDTLKNKDKAIEQKIDNIDTRLQSIEKKIALLNTNLSLKTNCYFRNEFKAER